MRRLFIFIVLIFSLFTITACNNKNEASDVSERYKTIAQEYIDKGDVETAIKVLEEGISLTNDESLKALLGEINSKKNEPDVKATEKEEPAEATESQQTSKPTQQNTDELSSVEGVYYHSGNADNIVVIYNYENSKIKFAICSMGARYTVGAIGEKEINNGVCEFGYTDTHGNTGEGRLTLSGGKLNLELSTTQYVGMYSIDITKGEYVRDGDVPSDLIIHEFCDGGIIF